MSDWTEKDGRSNSSDAYEALASVIEHIIRTSGHALLGGQAGSVARTILSNLAHKHHLGPRSTGCSHPQATRFAGGFCFEHQKQVAGLVEWCPACGSLRFEQSVGDLWSWTPWLAPGAP